MMLLQSVRSILRLMDGWGSCGLRRCSRRRNVGNSSRQALIEMLEPRALLSATLSPVAIGGIIDSPRDGIADSLSATPFALRSSSLEYRANAEFDLANLPEPTTLAVLDFTASINVSLDNVPLK